MRTINSTILIFLISFSTFLAQGFTDINAGLTGLHFSDVAWGDYDNDGDLDVLIAGADASDVGQTKLYKNVGSDTFTAVNALPFPGTFIGDFAWGDYDNDGDLDILIQGYTDASQITTLYKNMGSDTFTESGISFPILTDGSVSFSDYNNDGYKDILLVGFDNTSYVSKLYKNNGDATFTETITDIPGTIKCSYEWGDYDNDGDLDVFLSGFDFNGNLISQLYQNNGDETFTQTSNFFTGAWLGDAAWGDYDSDGDLDILLSGFAFPNDRIAKIYKNNGDGTFSEISSTGLVGVSHSSTIWGDYDNDGDLDVFIGGTYEGGGGWIRVTDVFINNSNDTFTEANLTFSKDVYWGESAWGDYDNDGDLDLICCGFDDLGGSNTIIYRNDNTVSNTIPQPPTNLSSNLSGTDVTLSWDAAIDNETPSAGLTYNAYLKKENGDIIWNSAADILTGYKLVPSLGNAQQNLNWTIKNLDFGSTYFFSVQAVDNNFAGSAFATEVSFLVDTTIPVELSAFNLSEIGNSVELKWITSTETNNSGFVIQRKTNENDDWQEISFVKGSGTSSEERIYSYIDEDVQPNSYLYRLKQIDFDGTFSYSEILAVTIDAPKEFALFQNYPNPFNPSTIIKFSLPFQTEVELNIYNALGEKVAQIFNGLLAEGIHEFTFDASSLPSGIYIYRIESGNFVKMKKMILIK